jgi:hypothetical protein
MTKSNPPDPQAPATVSMLVDSCLIFNLQRDTPSPRTSGGFAEVFRGSIEKIHPPFSSAKRSKGPNESFYGTQPLSRATDRVTETRRANMRHSAPKRGRWRSHRDTPGQYMAPSPRARSLAESRRHTGSIYGAQPLSRVTGGVIETRRVNMQRPALEWGHWLTH